MENLRQQFAKLIDVYGPLKVREIANKILPGAGRPIPAEHFQLLSPDALVATANQLDLANKNVLSAGNNRELTYGDKPSLIAEQTKLEAAIKLSEAEAFMNTIGEGKDQHGFVDGKKITLNNDANRDAYRRAYSAADRRALAETAGKIAAIDVELSQANDTFHVAVKVADTLAAKARLQAALLNFLSGRE